MVPSASSAAVSAQLEAEAFQREERGTSNSRSSRPGPCRRRRRRVPVPIAQQILHMQERLLNEVTQLREVRGQLRPIVARCYYHGIFKVSSAKISNRMTSKQHMFYALKQTFAKCATSYVVNISIRIHFELCQHTFIMQAMITLPCLVLAFSSVL